MSDPLWQARIDVPDTSWGSGFLVTDRHLLTCAHVVKDATTVTVTLRDSPRPRDATVVTAGPWFSPTAAGADIAVVELATPVAVEPARLGPHTGVEIYSRQPLSALGFPQGFDDGINPTFTAIPSKQIGSNVQFDATSPVGPWIEEGFSGAAAYHEDSGRVLGMIKSAVGGQVRTGVMVPIVRLAEHCPRLDDVIELGPFGPAAYTELRSALRQVRMRPEKVGQLLTLIRTTGVGDMPAHLTSLQAIVEALVVETVMVNDEQLRWHLGALLAWLGTPETGRWKDTHLGPAVPFATAPAPAAALAPVSHDCAIVVCLEPAAATGAESYELTIWTVTEPDGELSERVVDKQRLQRGQWRAAIEQQLVEARKRLPPTTGTVHVEFVLPRKFLSEPVDEWLDRTDDETPIGVSRPVAVRDLDWFSKPDPSDLVRRAGLLRAGGVSIGDALQWRDCTKPPGSVGAFRAWLREEEGGPFAVGLTAEWTGADHVGVAVAAGPPVMLWRRLPCPPGAHAGGAECASVRVVREIGDSLRGVTFDEIAQVVRKLRARALIEEDESHCGSAISLLRDDARRRPVPLGFVETVTE